MKNYILFFAAFCFTACSAFPSFAPTPDASATETRIAGNIYATQTANAPTPDPRVLETTIAARIYATQTASAPMPSGPTPTRTHAEIFGIVLDPYAKDGALIVHNPCEGKTEAYLLDHENNRVQTFYAERREIYTPELSSTFTEVSIFPHLPIGNYEVDACGVEVTTVYPGAIVELDAQ